MAVLVVLAGPAHATVVRYLELKEQVDLSRLVVRARTGKTATTFVGKDGRPRTDRPFEILETYKGDRKAGETVRVRQLLGETGEERLSIPGDAVFVDGEEVVLLLDVDETGTAYLTALGQSMYTVKPGEFGPTLERSLGELAFYQGGQLIPGGAEAPIPLDVFAKLVREYVRQGEDAR
ncbi:hypothetical protein AKJ08_1986 [Vulgatibacter incomptus]|uniref:Uncharacterized protein n=1 Tax=Vulgatibacter incomptus TaxID=1391653 RepID=A0A0K1PEQ0_9BACT|nr:hypothetical protein AKJ08_1986 [Vulgatibacter incomptus]